MLSVGPDIIALEMFLICERLKVANVLTVILSDGLWYRVRNTKARKRKTLFVPLNVEELPAVQDIDALYPHLQAVIKKAVG